MPKKFGKEEIVGKMATNPKSSKKTKASVSTPRSSPNKSVTPNPYAWLKLHVLAVILAFALRFWRISHPDQVVFDEVHFGKFASHYLQREYFFDLHPPLAKLMFAGVGWLLGYDGKFKFENIGDNYTLNHVPYIAYRSLAGTLGSVTVSLVFSILQGCGFSPASCFVGAAIVLFDSAQIAQTRLILLDAALIFFMCGALYSYVWFRHQRRNPYGVKWWAWLFATGFFLSCVISTKYVGLFTYLTIGVAVVAELCELLDVRGKTEDQRVSMKSFAKHFVARTYALVVFPFLLYLFWFYVHFQVLSNSGPGDSHMSAEFQATLNESPIVREALDIHFFDTLSVRMKNTDLYLHSHPHTYPMQYADGRISSQGQQVTGYGTHPDPNNYWQILPAVPMDELDVNAKGLVVGSQPIMLRHVATDTFLLTHDVASPGYNTNEEFTTVPREVAYGERYNDTQFMLDIVGAEDTVRTKMTQFRLKHIPTKVVMWLSDKTLPDWGFNQIEINGNKLVEAPNSVWYFSDIAGISDAEDETVRTPRRSVATGDVAPRRSFLTDYCELQVSMFRSNNMLKATHPYMSSPQDWPFMTRGISFWNGKDTNSQIYLVGNHVGWYLVITAFVLFLLLYVFDKLAMLREFEWVSSYAQHKLNMTLLWLFYGYCFHYLPFFLMGRQLFLHHYLPAHVLGALLVGGLVDFVTGQVDEPDLKYKSSRVTKAVVATITVALFVAFVYWAPLVYGLPLSPESVQHRQWFNIQLHYNK